jgi:hypothetical protein
VRLHQVEHPLVQLVQLDRRAVFARAELGPVRAGYACLVHCSVFFLYAAQLAVSWRSHRAAFLPYTSLRAVS